jgi:hypothetical protein
VGVLSSAGGSESIDSEPLWSWRGIGATVRREPVTASIRRAVMEDGCTNSDSIH